MLIDKSAATFGATNVASLGANFIPILSAKFAATFGATIVASLGATYIPLILFYSAATFGAIYIASLGADIVTYYSLYRKFHHNHNQSIPRNPSAHH